MIPHPYLKNKAKLVVISSPWRLALIYVCSPPCLIVTHLTKSHKNLPSEKLNMVTVDLCKFLLSSRQVNWPRHVAMLINVAY